MKRGRYGFSFMLLAAASVLLVPSLAIGVLAENMRFDPVPHAGDTSVSGICDQTLRCDGPIEVVIALGGVPGQNVEVLGEGMCQDGRFTINLCSILNGLSPTGGCLPYALQQGDVISAGQFHVIPPAPSQPENLCDSTPWLTVRAGIPTITQWGMVTLSILLALSAIVLIRRRRRA
jgi:hypothetical protein